jgi:hypothetical protein
VLDRGDDDVALRRGRGQRDAGAACSTPLSAKLFDSVAPLVKTISRAVAPRSAATSRRACSTASCAFHPHWCIDEAGLPKHSVKYGSIRSITRRSTGVVAW